MERIAKLQIEWMKRIDKMREEEGGKIKTITLGDSEYTYKLSDVWFGCMCNEICPSGDGYAKVLSKEGEKIIIVFNYNLYHDKTLKTKKCNICHRTNGHVGHFSNWEGSNGLMELIKKWEEYDDRGSYIEYMFKRSVESYTGEFVLKDSYTGIFSEIFSEFLEDKVIDICTEEYDFPGHS